MKIRIKGNSLRYRLTQSEVAKLSAEGSLQEHTEFAGKTLVYAIETVNSDQLAADFTGNRIVLSMSKSMIDELKSTDRVGYADSAGPLNLLIEKDFACLDNTQEDQSDNYPNPHLAC